MKIRVTPLRLWCLFAALILLTRSTHVAFAAAPPDAALALMLLGGMWIRRWPGFAGLMAAAFAADCIATGTLGVPDYCLSPAYAGLVPAYLVVWLSGWWLHEKRPQASLMVWLGTMLAASAAAFAISNAFWYAFSDGFTGWPIGRFVVGVLPYYPSYAGVAVGYVALAGFARLTAQHLARSRSLEPAS